MNIKSGKFLIAGAVCIAALAAAFAVYSGKDRDRTAGFISPSDPASVARGKLLYANQCAACHGANLEGQPDWRTRLPNGRLPAPPHDKSGHTWHHPDAVLFDIVKNGLVPGKTAPDGYQSDMPGFGQTLSDADIVAVLAYIKSTWPADILELQKSVTLQRQD
jgi:mono/diheme cytochrome c family protein